MTIAYLNGEFLPLEQARVSPMDRGFLFADAVYEVVPVYQGKLFRLKEHLQRLRRSLASIYLELEINETSWENIFNTLIQHNGGGNQLVYLQISRGTALNRDHSFPNHIAPTLFAYSSPLNFKTIAELRQGIQAITLPDIRWQHCDIKSVNLLANVLARQQATLAHAQEAILLRDGFALEGAASNLFIVSNNTIITPPIDNHILGGITRDLVIELASQLKIPIAEKPISETSLRQADEIWITSSGREITPVLQLDGHLVANGQVGLIWERMIVAYQQFRNMLC